MAHELAQLGTWVAGTTLATAPSEASSANTNHAFGNARVVNAMHAMINITGTTTGNVVIGFWLGTGTDYAPLDGWGSAGQRTFAKVSGTDINLIVPVEVARAGIGFTRHDALANTTVTIKVLA